MSEQLQSAIDALRVAVNVVRDSPLTRVRITVGDLELELERPPAADPSAASAVAVDQALPAVGELASENLADEVRAPLVGVFYRSSAPGEKPFVETGDRVEAGAQVAIIEAMKYMNPITASRAGTVAAILAANHEIVEFDQLLMTITPDSAASEGGR